jgi:hypothetical protein
LIEKIPDPQVRDGTLVSIIPKLMEKDLDRFVSVYTAMPPDSNSRANAGLVIGRTLAREFPDKAADFATQLDIGQIHIPNLILGAVFGELGRNGNARIAADWIARQPSQELKDLALHEYFDLRRNPVAPVREELMKRLQDAAR